MMILRRFLASTAGPYVLGGLGLLLAFFIASATYKSGKAAAAERKLAVATAALTDPVTKRPWQTLAGERERDLATCRGNTATLTTQLAEQSASVEALGLASAKATAAARDAVKAAGALSARAERRAGEIMAATPGADLCVSAYDLAREP